MSYRVAASFVILFAISTSTRALCLPPGEEKEDAENIKSLQKAAALGNAKAMNNLGECYLNGKGVEKDAVEAVKWFNKAAELGNADAMYNLGMHHFYGVEA